jgi:membrane protein
MVQQSKVTLKGLWQVLKQSGSNFMNDRVPKLSASLAYYTIFSFGPMIIVIIYLSGLFWGKQAIQGAILKQISGLVGMQAAQQIQQIIQNAAISTNTGPAAVIGFVALFVSATTVFSEIQDTINMIWKLKAKTGKGWKKMLLNRLLSFAIIATLGFLLLVSLIINVVIESLMDRLQNYFPGGSVVILYTINLVFTFLVISLLFGTIFKVLPDAVIRWKDVAVGALFTAALFMIGKFLITFYIGRSDVGTTYGTAGSLVVLLLWVYYSTIILYFGAEFTKTYATKFGCEIKPNEYAVLIQTVQIESNNQSVQQNELETESTQTQLQKTKDEIDHKKPAV